MENDFRRAYQLLHLARQHRLQSPNDAVTVLSQCLFILNRLVSIPVAPPQAHSMRLDAFLELAASHFALVHAFAILHVRLILLLGKLGSGCRGNFSW